MTMVNDAPLWQMIHNDDGRQTTAGNAYKKQQWTTHYDDITHNDGG
jgi:hypothetical protein